MHQPDIVQMLESYEWNSYMTMSVHKSQDRIY